jgi:Right handed beta helix region
MKLANSANCIIRRCYVHHNHGPGLWTDINSHDFVFEDNIIEFNEWEGTLSELSNHIILRRNICRWNGTRYRGDLENSLWGAQIMVQNSNDIEVASNYLECGPAHNSPRGSGQGVMAINQNRFMDEFAFGGKYGVHSLNVHHNMTVIPFGGHGGVDTGTSIASERRRRTKRHPSSRLFSRAPLLLSSGWKPRAFAMS